MADLIEAIHPAFDTKKIFLGTYNKTMQPTGLLIPEANQEITSRFDRGSLIINYTGHGSERLWADERVFTGDDIDGLENYRYPFLVTATCEFGRQDDPSITSSAERSLILSNGGSIGLVSTARPVNSATNFLLNQEFYAVLFQKEDDRFLTVGEIFRRTKNNSLSGVANRNFSLIGDPSMTLALPEEVVVIQEIKSTGGPDTLKALSTVSMRGDVRDGDNNIMANFHGLLEVVIYDKPVQSTTIGDNDPPYTFNEYRNAIFRGKATIQDGTFESSFVVPKSVDPIAGKGKISLDASDQVTGRDGAGADLSVSIGGAVPAPVPDNTPPVIALFMGDTTFVSGGVVTPNTTLLARLEDASGINISNFDPNTTLTAVLDGSGTFVLTEYYTSEKDDFTVGWIEYPLIDLSPGPHSLTVKAWDTYGNPAEATIQFIVTDGSALVIETLANFPNPFDSETSIYFTHNRSGDDLEGQLFLYSVAGQVLKTYDFEIPDTPYYVDLLQIHDLNDFGKKLPGGVYLARLAVRSLTNGAKSERVTKLIVLN
jgi:hypothetical protein